MLGYNYNMEEKEVLLALKAGDEEAFKSLYSRYKQKVYNFARLYNTSSFEVEEIVQEVFVKLWESRDALDVDKNFEGYLFIITRNYIFNSCRRHFNEPFYRVTVLEALEESYNIEEELETSDLREHVQALINMLPPRQQEVYRLSREKHLTYKEIASDLHISEKTVEHHISDALKFLKKNLLVYFLFASL